MYQKVWKYSTIIKYYNSLGTVCAMAQAVSCWPLTAKARVRARVDPCEICDGQSDTVAGFIRVLRFSPANIIPPLLHIHLSPPHEVCDSSDQAAHYHHLGASFLSRHFGWKQNKKVKKNV